MIGKTILHYNVLDRVDGTPGEYLAHDVLLDRRVVLKFLSPHYASDAHMKTQFHRTVRTIVKLNCPQIVRLYEIIEDVDHAFVVMESVSGQTLKQILAAERLSLSRALELAIKICEGLTAAHQVEVLHLDLTPERIVVDPDGKIKITDFGFSGFIDGTGLKDESSRLCTLSYRSPEQLKNKKVNHKSDIFSFGVILYEMVSGHLPFKEFQDSEGVYSIVHEKPEPLRNHKNHVPDTLQALIDKALDTELETRYQTTSELLKDLKREHINSSEMAVAAERKRKKVELVLFISALTILTMTVMLIIISFFEQKSLIFY